MIRLLKCEWLFVMACIVLLTAAPIAAQTGNASEVVWEETWLPGTLACGQRVTARVTMRNIGTTVWTKDVYKLGPVEDSDELNGPGRVLIESDEIDVVRPGEQFTFEFELEAPGNNSLRWTDWQMVHEGVEWFGEIVGQQVEVSCAVPVDGAQVVAANLPRSIGCGEAYQASVTMRNTGTTTWSEAGLYRLGAAGDQDDLGGPGRVLLPAGVTVEPGGQHTFTFELRGPEQASAVLLTDWRMVHDTVAWFGDTAGSLVDFSCTPPTDDAQVVTVTLPTTMECGQGYQASVTMKNIGTTTWSEGGLYRLGAAGDQDDLGGPGRVLLGGAEVPPGGQYTFHFELRAPEQPAQGLLTDWRMVHDNVAWFGETASSAVNVSCQQPVDDAVIVASNLPTSLGCGESYDAWVTVRNSGTTTWSEEALYRLGPVGDQDDLGGPSRVLLPTGVTVAPGGEHTFTFTLTAPERSGVVLTDWQMVHDNVAWFGAQAASQLTLACECPAGRCAAGCAIVPTLTASATEIGVAMPVTFSVANPDAVLDEFPNWDFGDGEHCEHCPRTVTHSYARPGTYAARLTATESRCGLTLVSEPVYVSVFDRAVPRNDNAEVVAYDLPAGLCTGTYPARVTMRNLGNTTWVPGEYSLGAVGDGDPFFDGVRVPLPAPVGPGEDVTFEFTLRPATEGCPFGRCRTDWQMVREGVKWFGGVAWQDVETSGCPTPGEADLLCRATARDEYGRPLPGRAVTLYAYEYGGKDDEPFDWKTGVTDAKGEALVTMDIQQPTRFLECRVDLQAVGRNFVGSIYENSGLPAGSVVTVDAIAVPEPTYSQEAPGLKSGSAIAHLYQSGPYDRVVVLPEPINTDEQKKGPRTRESFWQEFRTFAGAFYQLGIDVWLVNSSRTGGNIHEQAAEAAQAIDYAARGYPAEHGAAPEFNGKVVTVGISLGGVVTRIATARWESGAPEDTAWQEQLGLGRELPVSLVLFVDSPLRGANVPQSLQAFIWNPFGLPGVNKAAEINMNSCAFQQLVRKASWTLTNCEAGMPNPTCNWRAFYEDGRAVKFRAPGVCDSRSDTVCKCDPGPAVFSINGDGFPHGPRVIAYSDGNPGEPNMCYGNERDLDRGDRNMCAQKPWGRTLREGEEWLQMDVNNFPDEHFFLTAEDLVSGSRQSSLDGRKFYGIRGIPVADETVLREFSSPVFIPLSSAYGSESEVCAVDDCFHNTFNGGHVMPRGLAFERIRDEIMKATGGAASTAVAPEISAVFTAQPGESLAFDAASAASDGKVVWSLGDGTVRSGVSATHAYRRAGVYPVAVSVAMPDGSIATSTAVARIGVPENEAPTVSVRPAPSPAPGTSVVLSGEVTDADGRIVRTFWNFGDGEFGEGLNAAHTYAEPGTYTVTFSATDDEGAWTAAETVVAVGTPLPPTPLAPTGSVPAGVVTLSWSAVAGATGYRVVVFDGLNATVFSADVAATSCAGSSCSVQTSSSLAEGEYAWLVLARNDAGDGPLSQATRFVVVPAVNHPPAVSIEIASSCSNLCTVTFTAVASDPDGDALTYVWSGCSSGTGSSVTCQTRPAGDHAATVVVSDGRGASATASRAVTAYVASWATGTWSECKGAGDFTCTAAGANGCSRPGTQIRSVKPIAQTLDPGKAAPQPPSTQPCTETSAGFVASWSVGTWGACSVACGGGVQYRTVSPATFTSTLPGTDQPPTIQSCNTQACGLTCYNYTNMYPSKAECLSKGWSVCEVRYRGDGLGGTITCWKGF